MMVMLAIPLLMMALQSRSDTLFDCELVERERFFSLNHLHVRLSWKLLFNVYLSIDIKSGLRPTRQP